MWQIYATYISQCRTGLTFIHTVFSTCKRNRTWTIGFEIEPHWDEISLWNTTEQNRPQEKANLHTGKVWWAKLSVFFFLFLQDEAMDVILNGLDSYPWSNTAISRHIKKGLDDRLGPTWHVIVGESFSFEVTSQNENVIFLFYGSLGIVAWKCGSVLLNEMKHKAIKKMRPR